MLLQVFLHNGIYLSDCLSFNLIGSTPFFKQIINGRSFSISKTDQSIVKIISFHVIFKHPYLNPMN